MLSLFMCTSRSAALDDEAFAFETTPTRKKSLNTTSRGRKKASAKMVIGAPTDFIHNSHFGYGEIAGLNIEQYQREIEMKIAQLNQTTTSFPTRQPKPRVPPSPPRESELAFVNPSSDRRTPPPPSSPSTGGPRRTNTIKRKPAPPMLTGDFSYSSDVSSSPSSSPGFPPTPDATRSMQVRRPSESSSSQRRVTTTPGLGEPNNHNIPGPSAR